MQDIAFSCRCGQTHWSTPATKNVTRLICYCNDCQAFANHLGADHILESNGGSEIAQVSPRGVKISKGIENVGCLRLSPKGLMRWYAGCCDTPMANTLANPGVPFVGLLLGNCVGSTSHFGSVVAYVNTKGARGSDAPTKDVGLAKVVANFAKRAAVARLNGAYKDSPFFTFPARNPIATPNVLTKDQRIAATPA